jgi:1-acyl-sn-glycerol-3-phosphate acyltransferase
VLDIVTHGWTVRRWLEFDVGPTQRFTRRFLCWWMFVIWRMRAVGVENIPTEGAALSCPNHTHWADAWVQGVMHSRNIRYFGKRELVTSRGVGTYLRRAGVFPVHRGASDRTAIDLAELILRDGQFLVLYPEGTRCYKRGGGMGVPRRGAARLALTTGCMVLPSATWGLQPGTGREHLPTWLRWLPCTRRVTTVIGEPMRFEPEVDPSLERVSEVRDEIWRAIERCFEQARQLAI